MFSSIHFHSEKCPLLSFFIPWFCSWRYNGTFYANLIFGRVLWQSKMNLVFFCLFFDFFLDLQKRKEEENDKTCWYFDRQSLFCHESQETFFSLVLWWTEKVLLLSYISILNLVTGVKTVNKRFRHFSRFARGWLTMPYIYFSHLFLFLFFQWQKKRSCFIFFTN